MKSFMKMFYQLIRVDIKVRLSLYQNDQALIFFLMLTKEVPIVLEIATLLIPSTCMQGTAALI